MLKSFNSNERNIWKFADINGVGSFVLLRETENVTQISSPIATDNFLFIPPESAFTFVFLLIVKPTSSKKLLIVERIIFLETP